MRIVEISALSLSIIVTVLTLFRAAGWELGSGQILFILWAISPYIFLFLAGLVLRMTTAIPRLALPFCVTALLMLGFTLLAYVGTLGDASSTYGLIFLFVPFYLYVGAVIVLGVGLVLTLLSNSSKNKHM